ncbi:MAG: DUF4111 domain-containing protein [Clostridia bacterium]|nr:DUF4111 domain-containing protein [Clostridia bacterium]
MNDPQIILKEIKRFSEEILGSNLVGLYVHGSLAFGCFTWQNSDIDYLAVVERPLTQEEKTAYIAAVLELNKKAPPKGIEMSVVLAEHCRNFVHPTPYELHFSNAHLQRAEENTTAYCEAMHGLDPDLAAHFTVTRAVGKAFFGPEPAEMFAPVPRETYLDSIRLDIENAAEDIFENPVYMILNLCRVWAVLRDDAVLSKEQGGRWALPLLEPQLQPIVQAALNAYTGKAAFPMETLQNELPVFARKMLERIFP